MFKIFLVLLSIFVCVHAKGNQKPTADDLVITYLGINDPTFYNSKVRPSVTVGVGLGISFRQLVSLDEKAGIMTSTFYLNCQWIDQRLTWDSTDPELGNLTEIVVSATSIWTPDLAIINTAGTSVFINISSLNLARIDYLGNVYLILSLTGVQTRCKSNTYKFPFDSQNCSIQIGSWQLDTTRIDFNANQSSIDISGFQPSALWTLNSINTREVNTTSRFKSSTVKYQNQDIYYYVSISRRPQYYFLTFFPCFILNVATLCAFFARNAIVVQANLCMTVFLTFGVYALKINGDMPTQSEYIPIVSIYFIVSTIYTLISLVWFVVGNYFALKSRIPKPLVFIAEKFQYVFSFDWIAKIKEPKKKPSPDSAAKLGSIESVYRSPIETINQSVNKNKQQPEDDLRPRKVVLTDDLVKPCNSCPKPLCQGCDAKEKEKNKTKSQFDRNLKTLNLLAFIIVLLIMLISNLCIWISVAS